MPMNMGPKLSAAPSPNNGYQFAPAPARARITRAIWNAVFASVNARLAGIEAKGTELDDVINDLRLFGLQRLDVAIVPLIEQTQQQLADLQAEVAQTLEQNGEIIEDFEAQIAAALAGLNAQVEAFEVQINAQIAEVTAAVDEILSGGIPAANVAESAQRVFLTPAQKAEIGALRNDLAALDSEIDGNLAGIATAIGGINTALTAKQTKSEKNTANGYAGLNANAKLDKVTIQDFKEPGMVLVGTPVAANGLSAIDLSLSDLYSKYMVVIDGLMMAQATYLHARFATVGTTFLADAQYAQLELASMRTDSPSPGGADLSLAQTSIRLFTPTYTANSPINGEISFIRSVAAHVRQIRSLLAYGSSYGVAGDSEGRGLHYVTALWSALRLYPAAGAFTGGTVRLYGVPR